MSDIQKHKSDLQLISEKITENNFILKEGDIFISIDSSYRQFIKVDKIEVRELVDWAATRDTKANPSGAEIKVKEVYVKYDHNDDWDGTEWSSYDSMEISKFISKYSEYKLVKSIQEYYKEAQELIKNGNFDKYNDTDSDKVNTDNALIHLNSKEGLSVLREGMEEKRKNVQLINQFVKIEMAKKKAELDAIRKNLEVIVGDFKNKVAKIEKVIYTIELYLGIKEQIIQLQEGIPANENDVIYFRQQVLFMDEEFGDIGDDLKGLDFYNIEDFDNWLCKQKNYAKIIPEQKSIVVFKVRRNDKEYCDNPFLNTHYNIPNHKSYILIRNGENIYRIWADIQIERLFPKKSELMDLQMQIYNKENNIPTEERIWDNADKLKQKFDRTLMHYKQQLLMLQGLLDRTEILHPIPQGLTLLDAKCHDEGKVRFIYDDEIKLPDTRKEFWEWHKEINSHITFGSRVILSNVRCERGNSRLDERFHSEYKSINPPKDGIYSVEIYKKEVREAVYEKIPNKDYDPNKKNDFGNYEFYRRHAADENGNYKYNEYVKSFFCIRYNPNDTVINYWSTYDSGHERKNRLSYTIEPDDRFILNYDRITLDDIDFYLKSRVNRIHYLNMIPLLRTVKQLILKELALEKEFIKMVIGNMINIYGEKALSHENDLEAQIWLFIKKWKDNIKWMRPITQNDEKACVYVVKKATKYIENLK